MLAGILSPCTASASVWDVGADEAVSGTERDTVVTYENKGYFMVRIPKRISLDTATKSAGYGIMVKGELPSDAKVEVSPLDKLPDIEGINFYMTEQAVNKKDDVAATVTQEGTEWASSEVTQEGTEKAGTISAPGITAGRWEGSLIFEIIFHDGIHIHNFVDGVCTECGVEAPDEGTHTHNYMETITKEATCTEEGEKSLVCECGDAKTEVIPSKGHSYIDGVCAECGDADTNTEAHTHSYTETITKEATCTEEGERALVCECGDTKTESIPAKGHSYIDGVCSECNEADPEAVPVIEGFEDGGVYAAGAVLSLKEGEMLSINGTTVETAGAPYTFDTEGEYTVTVTGKNGNEITIMITISHIHNYEDGFCTGCGAADEAAFSKAGLYTATGKFLSGWAELTEDYGMDVSTDYTSSTCGSAASAPNLILSGSSVNPNNANLVLVLPDSVTSIGDYAFYGNTKLKTVIMPDSVTDIGQYAFSSCTNIRNIDIPDTVTDIGSNAFSGCTSLTRIKLPDSLENFGTRAFFGCTALSEVVIPDTVSKIGQNAFTNCTSLAEVDIPDTVTDIGDYAFSGCTALASIQLPKSLQNWGMSTFNGCTSLKEAVIPDTISYIGNSAFYKCTSLTGIDIPDSVTVIERDAFSGCTSLENVRIPDSMESIGSNAFNSCVSLVLEVPDSVSAISDYAFHLVPQVIYNGQAEGAPWSARALNGYMEGSLVYNAPSKGILLACVANAEGEAKIADSTSQIGNHAFLKCAKVTGVQIPDSVKQIGEYAFNECTSLTEIEMPDSIEQMGRYAFAACSSLSAVRLSDNISSISKGAFSACTSLTGIEVPANASSIGEQAFYGCTSLANVEIADGVKSIESLAFGNCKALRSLYIPASVQTAITNNKGYFIKNLEDDLFLWV